MKRIHSLILHVRTATIKTTTATLDLNLFLLFLEIFSDATMFKSLRIPLFSLSFYFFSVVVVLCKQVDNNNNDSSEDEKLKKQKNCADDMGMNVKCVVQNELCQQILLPTP